LWSSFPCYDKSQTQHHCTTDDDYVNFVKVRQKAERITSVLYPKDKIISYEVQEHLIKQQYFFCAASIHDICRRFKKKNKEFVNFAEKNAIQLNDAHPAIAIVELLRVLVDQEELTIQQAWLIANQTFSYTSHSDGIEHAEKWSVELLAKILPRHLEIILVLNYFLIQKVKQQYPDDNARLARMSLIEQGPDSHQFVRMSYICIIGSHIVNGVSLEHTAILKTLAYKDFHELFPQKIISITNGVSQRRWIACANPALADLITSRLSDDEWLMYLFLLSELNAWKFDPDFMRKWTEVRDQNKQKLFGYLKKHNDRDGIHKEFFNQRKHDVMVDAMAKHILPKKRQLMFILYIVIRYLRIKEDGERPLGARLFLFSGRSPDKSEEGKRMLQFIIKLISFINADTATQKQLQMAFIPNFNVSLAELIIPATDLSQHISTPGTEVNQFVTGFIAKWHFKHEVPDEWGSNSGQSRRGQPRNREGSGRRQHLPLWV